jgi:hypothetical protein
MNKVRILIQGVTKDAEAFGAFMKPEAETLEEAELGTLLMEVSWTRRAGPSSSMNATRMLMLSSHTPRG